MTLLSSIGFHYFETVNQSLQLQWIDKDRAPVVLGRIVAVGAGASLAAYGAIVALWDALGLDYNTVYLASGGLTLADRALRGAGLSAIRGAASAAQAHGAAAALLAVLRACSSWRARGGRFSWSSPAS